jgi:dedicator of cytokinesis protein 3
MRNYCEVSLKAALASCTLSNCSQGFETTFELEMATFAPQPAPSPREVVSTPSPRWTRSPTISEKSPPNIASALNGEAGEEASIMRPVSLRQRGPTLSILSGRRKDSDPARPAELTNGTVEANSHHRRSTSSKDRNRRSLFRNPVASIGDAIDSKTSTWEATLGAARKSFDQATTAVSEVPSNHLQPEDGGGDAELGKRGSVRKRLSMLRLGGGGGGKKNKGPGMMGSLDEE